MSDESNDRSNEITQRLVGVEDISKILGVSARHIYRLEAFGRMPKSIKLGGSIRWDLVAIHKWIDAGCPSLNQEAIEKETFSDANEEGFIRG